MRMVDHFIGELDQESVATREMLNRVPEEKLDWRPHDKSMSLGELALHIARTPGSVAQLAAVDEMDVSEITGDGAPSSKSEILASLDESLAQAKDVLNGFGDESMMATWALKAGEDEVMSMPRVGLVRAILLNHWYHHRGQLSVYLRLLGVPLPSVYGPTADENPFM